MGVIKGMLAQDLGGKISCVLCVRIRYIRCGLGNDQCARVSVPPLQRMEKCTGCLKYFDLRP